MIASAGEVPARDCFELALSVCPLLQADGLRCLAMESVATVAGTVTLAAKKRLPQVDPVATGPGARESPSTRQPHIPITGCLGTRDFVGPLYDSLVRLSPPEAKS